jgi:hypothetical protein
MLTVLNKTLAPPNTEKVAPRRAKERSATEEPRAVKPITDNAEPTRAKDRKEIDDPRQA